MFPAPISANELESSYFVLLPFLIFAHLARCAAAIFALAATDMVRFAFRAPVVADVPTLRSLIFAHRALCAAAILVRAAAVNVLLPRPPFVFPTYEPANAASAELSPSSCLATRSRSDLKIAAMSKIPPEGSNCIRPFTPTPRLGNHQHGMLRRPRDVSIWNAVISARC